MAYEPMYYDSSEVGAPALNNAAGALLAVLQACLVDGFNSKSVTSIVVASNVATVTCSTHGFTCGPGKPVQIAGATPGGLNGNKICTWVSANVFTFPTTGISDQTATGTITAKRPGIGWTRQYSGTNKAVYKSSDVTATGRLLRVDDTTASSTDARARMYETMSDVDTGTGPSPTDAQQSGGTYWSKGPNDATAKTWALVGDEKFFYLLTQIGFAASSLKYLQGFGDVISYRASDAYHCMIAGGTSSIGGSSSGSTGLAQITSVGAQPGVAGAWFSRSSLQVGTSVRFGVGGVAQNGNSVFGSPSQPAWPSPVDNGLLFHRPMYGIEENSLYSNPIRGELPGIVQPLGSQPYNDRDILDTIDGFGSSKLVILTIQNGGTPGRVAYDLTGPWR